MTQSKYLSGKYKGQKYDRAVIRHSEIFDDFLIFDISDGCKFIAWRGDLALAVGQGSLYGIMSPESARQVRDHAMSYERLPMFVDTEHGVALVVTELVPSSSLGVLIFPKIGARKLCRFFERREIDVAFAGELTAPALMGKIRLSAAEERDCERLWGLVCDAICRPAEECVCGDATELIEQSIYAASAYVGCPVYVGCQAPAINLCGLDLPMLKAFLLVVLSSAVRVSRRAQATVSIESCTHGVGVRVSIEMKKGRGISPDTARAICAIADRNRMLIEYMPDESITHVRLCPIRHDWSLMNIKTPSAAEANAQG